MSRILNRKSDPEQGSALVVTLAILFIMSTIAVLFAFVSRKEYRSTQRDIMSVRSQLLAHTGLEDAIELIRENRLDEELKFPVYNNVSGGGSYLDELDIGDPSNLPGVPPNYQQSPENIDPKYARKPTGNLGTIPVELSGSTIDLGYSGQLPPSILGGRDTYSLKISDNSTKIVVDGTNKNMKTAINYLCEELSGCNGTKKPGTKIKNAEFGPRELNSVDDLCCEILDRDTFQILEPFLTVSSHTWLDRSVISPNPHSPGTSTNVSSNNANNGNRLLSYKFDSLTKEPRAPVNINRAQEELLVALLRDLEANPLAVDQITNNSNGQAEHRFINIGRITHDNARTIASNITDYRTSSDGPFESWQEFENFVDSRLVKDTSNNITKAKGYLLKAHFNPNTRFAKFNYDKNATWSWEKEGSKTRMFLDKTDFTYYTTEFTFHSTGYYTVKSYGRVTGKDDSIVAESSLRSVIQSFQVTKHTTQQDFLLNSEADNPQTRGTFLPESVSNTTYSVDGNPKYAAYSGKQTGADLSGMFGFNHTTSLSSWNHEELTPRKVSNFLSRTGYIKRGGDHPDEDPGDLDLEAWGLRTFGKDAKTDEEGPRSGLVPDRKPSGAADYPDADPLPYSDVSGEGFLIGSDRGRTIRFNTTDLSRSQTWRNGHLEFWWKPKASINLSDQSDIGTQYKTDGEQLILAEMLFLSNDVDIEVPRYTNSEFIDLDSGSSAFMSYLQPEELGISDEEPTGRSSDVNFITRNLPGLEGYNNNFNSDDEGSFSGYYLKFWLQDETWHFLVRFRSFFDPDIDSGSNPTIPFHNKIDADPGEDKKIVSGATLSKAPYDQAKPNIREWNRIVLDWRPQDHTKQFMGGSCGAQNPEAICAQEKNITLLTGRFRINDQTDKEVNTWAEGELAGNRMAISNFMDANTSEGELTIGYLRGGWPLSWFQHESQWLNFPTIIGPKRLKQYRSFGHVGGVVRKRGSKLESSYNMEPDVDHHNFRESYAEGTVDDIYFGASKGTGDSEGATPDPELSKRYTRNNTEYQGRFYSRNSTKIQNAKEQLDVNVSENELKQKTLTGGTDKPLRLLRIAFTQYEPLYFSSDASQRPYFCLESIKTYSTEYNSSCSNEARSGKLVKPEDLFNLEQPIEINPDRYSNRHLKYTLKAKSPSAGGTTWNASPFLEDITVLYEVPGDEIKHIHFYNLSEGP